MVDANIGGFADMIVGVGDSLRDIMRCIDRNRKGIALIVDDEGRLVGTISDGDVRRAILSGVTLESKSDEILRRREKTANPKPVTATIDAGKEDLLRVMQERSVRQIPIVDCDERVVDLVTIEDLMPEEIPSVQAVIMAGGYGKRLRPLTEDVPKPMLHVGDKPLMEHMIDKLRQSGINKVNITTHYKPEKISEYFGDGRDFGVELTYLSEESPLGTAGALGLLSAPQEPVLVINGDLITQVDFKALLAFHREHEAHFTVAVRQYDVEVPYGVVDCEGGAVTGVREKPVFNFFVNAGIYLLEPFVYDCIPRGERFDMTELIQALIEDGKRVCSFPIVEYWLDIGRHADYTQAQKDVMEGRITL
jgi:dTDP-glucose pyrophosphorylase